MTKIKSVVKTYSDDLVHNGYFIVTDNYRLKWASKWTYENMMKQTLFKSGLDLDKYLQRLENAQ